MSLPSRECGLKFHRRWGYNHTGRVTPFAGVWIEIFYPADLLLAFPASLPSRECGLKYFPIPPMNVLSRHSLRGSVD